MYWVNVGGIGGGAVKSCAFDDCASTMVKYADSWLQTNTVAVAGANVYWNDLGQEGHILTCPIAGCPDTAPTILVTSSELYRFIVDETQLYWATSAGTIRRCSLPGCLTSEPIGTIDGVYAIVEGGTELFVVALHDGSPKGDIVAVTKDGSLPPRIVAASQHLPHSIAVDAERVYWTNSYAAGMVASCPRSGCDAEPIVLATAQRDPTNLVVDDRNLYFVHPFDFTHPGEILECPLVGCGAAPKVLAQGQRAAGYGLALDGTHVYWSNGGQVLGVTDLDGNISRIRK